MLSMMRVLGPFQSENNNNNKSYYMLGDSKRKLSVSETPNVEWRDVSR